MRAGNADSLFRNSKRARKARRKCARSVRRTIKDVLREEGIQLVSYNDDNHFSAVDRV